MATQDNTLAPLNDFWALVSGIRNDISIVFIRCIKRLFLAQDSVFVFVKGKRGSGKTDLALLIAEILHGIGIIKHVATNTKIYDSNFRIDEINNLQDLKYWAKTRYGKKLFIFDEIADAMPRRRPMAHLTVELIKEFNKLRKHKLSIIGTTISEDVLDKSALQRDLLDARFIKKWLPKGNPQIYKIAHYDNFLTNETIYWDSIPPTSVKFDTWDSSPFTDKPTRTKNEIKDKNMLLVYEWAKGKTYKDLGIHAQQLTRIKKKIIPILIEHYLNTSPNKEEG